jgi:hypothetical protein
MGSVDQQSWWANQNLTCLEVVFEGAVEGLRGWEAERATDNDAWDAGRAKDGWVGYKAEEALSAWPHSRRKWLLRWLWWLWAFVSVWASVSEEPIIIASRINTPLKKVMQPCLQPSIPPSAARAITKKP